MPIWGRAGVGCVSVVCVCGWCVCVGGGEWVPPPHPTPMGTTHSRFYIVCFCEPHRTFYMFVFFESSHFLFCFLTKLLNSDFRRNRPTYTEQSSFRSSQGLLLYLLLELADYNYNCQRINIYTFCGHKSSNVDTHES